MELINDALSLCSEFLATSNDWIPFGNKRYIAQERSEDKTEDVILYSHPITPRYLESKSILTIISSNYKRNMFSKIRPKGFLYIEFFPDIMTTWIDKVINEEIMKYKERSTTIPKKLDFTWEADYERHRGTLILSNKKFTFHGSRFGGIDILLNNINKEVSRKELTSAIDRHSQNKRSFTLSQWKYQILNEKKGFSDFFNLDFIEPSFYRLTTKS